MSLFEYRVFGKIYRINSQESGVRVWETGIISRGSGWVPLFGKIFRANTLKAWSRFLKLSTVDWMDYQVTTTWAMQLSKAVGWTKSEATLTTAACFIWFQYTVHRQTHTLFVCCAAQRTESKWLTVQLSLTRPFIHTHNIHIQRHHQNQNHVIYLQTRIRGYYIMWMNK